MRYAVLLLLVATPAFAQAPAAKPAKTSGVEHNLGLGKHDRNAPVHISSDSFGSDVKAENGDYIGNVLVTQGDLKMRADRMHFDTSKGDLSIITATGHVVVDGPRGTGTGDRGIYDLGTRLVTLTGHVVLTKQKDVMRGTKLVMDMNTNLAHLTADGSQGGRVQAVLIPKQHPQSGEADGTPPKSPDNSGK
ncbi:MAG: lipopolysaccharide transport periplasmic protein LptA [Rhizomicrobium sp.]|jgi:lipopolysaccharide export system protein LptA